MEASTTSMEAAATAAEAAAAAGGRIMGKQTGQQQRECGNHQRPAHGGLLFCSSSRDRSNTPC
jgi:hypothetical protein